MKGKQVTVCGWVAMGSLVFAVGSACSADDEPTVAASAGVAGEAGAQGGATPTGGLGGGGTGGTGSAGEGASAGQAGQGGAAGCSLENVCGGCSQPQFTVKCSWANVVVPAEIGDTQTDVEAACDYSRGVLLAMGGAGAGGAGAGGAGAGGANAGGADAGGADNATDPISSLCSTYQAPGTVIVDCSGCTETDTKKKAGECVIGGECCVIESYTHCGT